MEKVIEFLVASTHHYYYFLLILLPLLYLIFKSPRNLPPGPFPWPILGNILSLGNNPHVSLAKLATSYGPLISLRLGTQVLVVGSSEAAATEILKTHDKSLSARYVPRANAFYPDRLDFSIGWTDCTDQWKFMRTFVKTELFSPKAIQAQSGIRELKVSEMIELLTTKEEGEEVNIPELVFSVVFNILSNILVSVDFLNLYEEDEKGFKEYIRIYADLVSTPNLADYYKIVSELDLQGLNRKGREILVKFTALWEATLKEKLENKVTDVSRKRDVMDGLFERTPSKDQADCLILDLLFAGTDTTVSTVEWALAELIKSPEAMNNVCNEIQRNIKGSSVKESDLQSLPYLHYVLKETLRLHPPAPLLLPRRALETCKVMNYTIPKDTQIFVNAWAIGRDPKIWDDPFTFKPERFLETSLELNTGEYNFIAFGSGRRICPGIPMANKQVPLILASLLKSFDWSLPPYLKPTELDMEEKFGLTLQKEKPIVLIPKFKPSSA